MTESERSRTDSVVVNLTKNWPFSDNSFDGIFCTGTLHFFNKEELAKIFQKMDRVLKPGGKVILNVGTNITRVMPNKEILVHPNEPQYELSDARDFLETSFREYDAQFFVEPPESFDYMDANPPFTYTSSVLLMSAQKPQG